MTLRTLAATALLSAISAGCAPSLTFPAGQWKMVGVKNSPAGPTITTESFCEDVAESLNRAALAQIFNDRMAHCVTRAFDSIEGGVSFTVACADATRRWETSATIQRQFSDAFYILARIHRTDAATPSPARIASAIFSRIAPACPPFPPAVLSGPGAAGVFGPP